MDSKFILFMLGCLLTVMYVSCDGDEDDDTTKPLQGSCPDYPLISDFNPGNYGGKWYGTYYIKGGRAFVASRCHVSTRQVGDDGYLTTDDKFVTNGGEGSYTVTGPQVDGKPGQWNVDESTYPGVNQVQTTLATDYNNYLVYVRCANLGTDNYACKKNLVLIQSRNPTIGDDDLNAAKEAITNAGISLDNLVKSDQDGCGY